MATTPQQDLDNILPKSLDDIIRANRDKCSLSLSTREELAELPSIVEMMDDQKPIHAKLNGWYFICIKEFDAKLHFLTGFHEAQDCVWATSVIVALDLEHGHALTKSGNIYQLGTKGEGDPGQAILLHICAQFHNWGIGEKLGVPHIFY